MSEYVLECYSTTNGHGLWTQAVYWLLVMGAEEALSTLRLYKSLCFLVRFR